jgi:CRP-like cAMP-binding protein
MEDLDFYSKPTAPAPQEQSAFDSAAALEFFQSAGNEQEFAENEVVFSENQTSNRFLLQRNKMYLLLDGSIKLTVQGRTIGTVHKGEIFGEMASLTQLPRSATATAGASCRVIALDDKQFKSALQENPGFALTLMVLMSRRLRRMIAEFKATAKIASEAEVDEFPVLDKNLLASLIEELDDNAMMRYEKGRVIMQEGQAGVFMYIVLEGLVKITLQGRVVEEIGSGGIFGEMALVERSERLASAIADTDCAVLAINRASFLSLVGDNPEFGLAILGAIGERLRFMLTKYTE